MGACSYHKGAGRWRARRRRAGDGVSGGGAAVGQSASAGPRCLTLEDKDPYDFAKAERLFPPSRRVVATFTIMPAQNDTGTLEIEFQDAKGDVAVRLIMDSDSVFRSKAALRMKKIMNYSARQWDTVRVTLSADTRMYTVNVDGKDRLTQLFFSPVDSLERIVFRTGETRHYPTPDAPAEQDYDLPQGGEQVGNAAYYIKSLSIQ